VVLINSCLNFILIFEVTNSHKITESINKVETIIYYSILFLLVIGFISYGGEISDTLKRSKNLTWVDVFSDSDVCHLTDRKSFLHYLKLGIGIKL